MIEPRVHSLRRGKAFRMRGTGTEVRVQGCRRRENRWKRIRQTDKEANEGQRQ